MIRLTAYLLSVTALLAACHSNTVPVNIPKQLKTIVIQPFSGVPAEQTAYVFAELKKIYPLVQMQQAVELPRAGWNPARNRYRADSLIGYLKNICAADAIMPGLTNKDISVTKGNVPDWGVIGLGFCPGSACIVSGFRLGKAQKKVQLFRAVVHELGHTRGLPHCSVATCLMKDAEGKNRMNEEQSFCATCTHYLQERGWQLR